MTERLSNIPDPTVIIVISVDVNYIIGQQDNVITKGIYMMDNSLNTGSTGEGTMDLCTVGSTGALVSWKAMPMDYNAVEMGQSVVITGFQVCQGNVFGTVGFPEKQPGIGDYWIGQLMYDGTQMYQIQIKVTSGVLQPVSFLINWNATISAK